MSPVAPVFPRSSPDDLQDVCDALDTGYALWQKGDPIEALRWLRRARDFADEAGNDRRALELARVAADLSSITGTPVASAPIASTTVSQPTASTPVEPRRSKLPEPPAASTPVEPRRSKLPEPPAAIQKFTEKTESPSVTAPTPTVRKSETSTAVTKPQQNASRPTVNERPPSLRPAAPSQRGSSIPRPAGQDRSSVLSTRLVTTTPGQETPTESDATLVSVCVRIAGIEDDGSLRVYPMGQQTSTTPTNHGILVLSEKRWSTLNRR